jgi:plasmid stabilization system protein ParE
VGKKIVWSKEALLRFDIVIDYLKSNWTEKEVISFVSETDRILKTIATNPEAFRKSKKTNYREVLITKHNLLLYSVSGGHIRLVTFWDTRQNPRKRFK